MLNLCKIFFHSFDLSGRNQGGPFLGGKKVVFVCEFIIPDMVHISSSMKIDLFYGTAPFQTVKGIQSLFSLLVQPALGITFAEIYQQNVKLQYLPCVASTAPNPLWAKRWALSQQ